MAEIFDIRRDADKLIPLLQTGDEATCRFDSSVLLHRTITDHLVEVLAYKDGKRIVEFKEGT